MAGKELSTVDSYRSASLDERRAYAGSLAQAGNALPAALRYDAGLVDGNGRALANQINPGKVLLLAETGAMLGIHPMAALQGVYIVEGRPTLSASLLAALTRRAGHTLRVRLEGDGDQMKATATLIRADDPDYPFEVVWTVDRAKTAGLWGKRGPWTNYPGAMLKNRAITEVIREGASDVTLVPAYTPDEINANLNVTEGGELIATRDESVDGRREDDQIPKTQAPIQDPPAKAPAGPPAGADSPEGQNAPETAAQPEGEVDPLPGWISRVESASTSQEVREVYKEAGRRGMLNQPVTFEGKEVPLQAWLIKVGQALDELEQQASEGGPEGDAAADVLHGEPSAAADDDVVVATIEPDEQP